MRKPRTRLPNIPSIHMINELTVIANAVPKDAALEARITRLGLLMCRAMNRYIASRNPRDKARAERWLRLQTAAIKSRSPATVRSMESERGLA